MKNILILIPMLTFFIGVSQGQSYLAVTNNKANLREAPDKQSEGLDLLDKNVNLFVYSLETTNDYYQVIEIDTDQEGWVHKSLVRIIKEIPRSTESPFSPEGNTGNYDCSIEVTNNTSLSLTLKMNSYYYYFDPHETKTLTVAPGQYEYIASAPSVIPYYGDDHLNAGYKYSWTFYVKTEYVSGGSGKRYYSKRKRRR